MARAVGIGRYGAVLIGGELRRRELAGLRGSRGDNGYAEEPEAGSLAQRQFVEGIRREEVTRQI